MIISVPVINDSTRRTDGYGNLLAQSRLLLYKGKVYDMSITQYNFYPNTLEELIENGAFPILKINVHSYGVYRHGEVVEQHLCMLSLYKPSGSLVEFVIPFQWTLKRQPRVQLYYGNLLCRILRVQRFLRKILTTRQAERALALAMSLHLRLGRNSLLKQLPLEVIRNIVGR